MFFLGFSPFSISTPELPLHALTRTHVGSEVPRVMQSQGCNFNNWSVNISFGGSADSKVKPDLSPAMLLFV